MATSSLGQDYTEEQLKKFKNSRSSYFKGTIAVACIYGAFALILFLIAVISSNGKSIITDAMLPFTITFIGGMIFVTAVLVISLLTAKPPPVVQFGYDNIQCPDYWKLEKTPSNVLYGIEGSDKLRMKYRCVRDPKFSTVSNGNNSVAWSSDQATEKRVMELSKVMNNGNYNEADGVGTGAVNCNTIYPDFMNYYDTKNDQYEPNKLRCSYATKCNVPWSAVCPNKP
jgi:hypothetical protein